MRTVRYRDLVSQHSTGLDDLECVGLGGQCEGGYQGDDIQPLVWEGVTHFLVHRDRGDQPEDGVVGMAYISCIVQKGSTGSNLRLEGR